MILLVLKAQCLGIVSGLCVSCIPAAPIGRLQKCVLRSDVKFLSWLSVFLLLKASVQSLSVIGVP